MAVQNLKIIVAGSMNSGKSTFIESMTSTEVVVTANWIGDYQTAQRARARHFSRSSITTESGRVTVDSDLSLSLHSVASNLSSIFSIPRGMRGFVLLIDSTDQRSFYEARALLLYMAHFPRVPYIVVANKQDLERALTVDQIRQKMRLPDHVPMMSCISKERDSVRDVLLELLYMILE